MQNRRCFLRLVVFFLLLFSLSPTAGWAASLPDSAYISGVPGHPQTYMLSCESRSAADWAAFWGVELSETEFLSNLPRSDNPDEGFVGNPNDPWGSVPPASYGVHAGPVARLLRDYGLEAEAKRGLKWKDLRKEIASGRPVIVWVIGGMWTGSPRPYTDQDGESTTVAPYEHSMILVGYDPQRVQVIDAGSGQTQSYALSAFLASWSVLGNMAVVGRGEVEEEESEPEPEADVQVEEEQTAENRYTVQPGDYLVAVAAQTGTSWKTLVDLNGITYPYTLYPGQVLNLPVAGRGGQSEEAGAGEAESPDEAQPMEEPADEEGETYTVQPGDYLKMIADRFGLDWQTLAERNGIGYPYVIQAGQILRLK